MGPGASNLRDDVLLVQYFLREIFKNTPKFQQEPFAGEVKVDGVPTPNFFAAIRHFQMVEKKDGKLIATDGVIDAPKEEFPRGAISGTQYTILFMNNRFRSARPQDWPRVSQATDCPTEIRASLREPRFP